MNTREMVTVIVALREMQRVDENVRTHIPYIAANGDCTPLLSDAEIDVLCTVLNTEIELRQKKTRSVEWWRIDGEITMVLRETYLVYVGQDSSGLSVTGFERMAAQQGWTKVPFIQAMQEKGQ